eukprot:TRINITY_DN10875_c0_g1_i3.p1 TRINITY_DN10875_c0_g1~~TRINITY_DN10875_c0_g1_i3.p1  ORF type:complete len:139 (+),score=54.39 TRINITY_DN10875_c0_g1_i3:83-499(+)
MKRKREDNNDSSDDSYKKSKKSKKDKVKKEKKKKDKKKKEKKTKDKKHKKDVKPAKEIVSEETLEERKRMVPMTKEEWEKQQSVVRRVYDEDTGRMRLVKGTGEILEECVSRERQQAINKQATQADGESFQRDLTKRL